MSDHRQYVKKPIISNDIIDADNFEENAKENESELEFDKKLIALVEFRPWIYDKISKKKLTKSSMEEGWQQIAEYLNTTVEYCQKRWRLLKQYYSKERLLRDTGMKKWPLFESMDYIDGFMPRKATPNSKTTALKDQSNFADRDQIKDNQVLMDESHDNGNKSDEDMQSQPNESFAYDQVSNISDPMQTDISDSEGAKEFHSYMHPPPTPSPEKSPVAQKKRISTDDNNSRESTTFPVSKKTKPSSTVYDKAFDIVNQGSDFLKEINNTFDLKTPEKLPQAEIIDDENNSTADVLYNRLKKIKGIDRQADFKMKTFEILYSNI